MTHEFFRLSPADFEDLSRDLVGRAVGNRFEAFALGPDGGIDGRHAPAGSKTTILQAKHYERSGFSNLKSVMRRERAAIDTLAPERYVLATSCPLTPDNKADLANVLGPSLKSQDDIFGADDLRGLLREFPEVEKAHIKLWLSSSAVLEQVLWAASRKYTSITLEEIEAKVRVYAPNPSFEAARSILESRHVVIISGPPGVGKTTLGEMLAYAYLADGWEFIALRGLEEGFTEIDDLKKQIFFFDDFLGRVELDRHALARSDSEIARFIGRVGRSKNARFILTTRAPIFEEARRYSEHLGNRNLDITRYALDVGIYTRRIRALILYNHLLVAGTPQAHINALVVSPLLPRVVDHKNFNPRIVEWMTDSDRLGDVPPDAYVSRFIDALSNPGKLWETAFRNHIPKPCQHLLIALFFGSQYRVRIEDLRVAFDSLHPLLCATYGDRLDPKDFEDSLRVLEGGFVTLHGTEVAFINPSLRDYLTSYLDDVSLLTLAARSAQLSDWAKSVWDHSARLKLDNTAKAALSQAFRSIAERFKTLPVNRIEPDGHHSRIHAVGISNVSRMELLLEWWKATDDTYFLDLARELAARPVERLDSWRDGESGISLLAHLRDDYIFDDIPQIGEMADALEYNLVQMIDYGPALDDMERIADAAHLNEPSIGHVIIEAVRSAIDSEIRNVESYIEDIHSESTLEEHMQALDRLGKRSSLPAREIKRALLAIDERIGILQESSKPSPGLSSRPSLREAEDRFDDTAIRTLFLPLARQE